MDYSYWKEEAIKRVKEYSNIGDIFELKDLFEKKTWDKLTSSEKRSFGRFFSGEVKENRISQVIYFDESKSHHNLYKRVE